MSLLCIGQAVYDITFPLDETLIENQKYRINHRMECMGAPAANAAYLNALWGNDTTLIARVGNDLYGHEIQRVLQGVGVHTNAMYIEKDLSTSISCILTNTKNGNRTILNTPMPPTSFHISDMESCPHVILVDGHENDASLQAFKKYPNAITMIDAGTYKKELEPIIKNIDYLVCSQDFAYQYTGIHIHTSNFQTVTTTFEKLRALQPRNVIVTIGDKGLLYEDEQKQIHHIPAFLSNPIDTTGAGDIFHGAFAYCIDNHISLEDSLFISSMTSAISVEHFGGQTSIPNREDVKNRLQAEDIFIDF